MMSRGESSRRRALERPPPSSGHAAKLRRPRFDPEQEERNAHIQKFQMALLQLAPFIGSARSPNLHYAMLNTLTPDQMYTLKAIIAEAEEVLHPSGPWDPPDGHGEEMEESDFAGAECGFADHDGETAFYSQQQQQQHHRHGEDERWRLRAASSTESRPPITMRQSGVGAARSSASSAYSTASSSSSSASSSRSSQASHGHMQQQHQPQQQQRRRSSSSASALPPAAYARFTHERFAPGSRAGSLDSVAERPLSYSLPQQLPPPPRIPASDTFVETARRPKKRKSGEVSGANPPSQEPQRLMMRSASLGILDEDARSFASLAEETKFPHQRSSGKVPLKSELPPARLNAATAGSPETLTVHYLMGKTVHECTVTIGTASRFDVSALPADFVAANVVYPASLGPREAYTGRRFEYERHYSALGLHLAWLNQPVLDGNKSALVAAVEALRSLRPELVADRLRRKPRAPAGGGGTSDDGSQLRSGSGVGPGVPGSGSQGAAAPKPLQASRPGWPPGESQGRKGPLADIVSAASQQQLLMQQGKRASPKAVRPRTFELNVNGVFIKLKIFSHPPIPEDFKASNCVFPPNAVADGGGGDENADCGNGEEPGRPPLGSAERARYEQECNNLGWELAWCNPAALAGNRKALQDAVAAFRGLSSGARPKLFASTIFANQIMGAPIADALQVSTAAGEDGAAPPTSTPLSDSPAKQQQQPQKTKKKKPVGAKKGEPLAAAEAKGLDNAADVSLVLDMPGREDSPMFFMHEEQQNSGTVDNLFLEAGSPPNEGHEQPPPSAEFEALGLLPLDFAQYTDSPLGDFGLEAGRY